MLNGVKENMFPMNEQIGHLSREVENYKEKEPRKNSTIKK